MNQAISQDKLIRLQNRIRARKGLVGCGAEYTVALRADGYPIYVGADRYGQAEVQTWRATTALICGSDGVFGIMEDGSLAFAGKDNGGDEIMGLSHVRSLSFGRGHTAALLGNGRVFATGDDRRGQCRVQDFPAVTDMICGEDFTAGLTPSGQVVITGGSRLLRHTVRSWRGVAGIFSDTLGKEVYAITDEGRLISTRRLPRSTGEWKNIIYLAANSRYLWAISATGELYTTAPAAWSFDASKEYVTVAAGERHAVALTRDGYALSVGENHFGQCDTARMGRLFESFDVLSAERRERHLAMARAERTYQIRLTEAARYRGRVVAGERMTAALTADGRVLTSVPLSHAKGWTHVRSIACGGAHLLALHEDGHVSADGNQVDGSLDVSDWQNVKSVAAGKYHSLALTEDGRVLFCGRNDRGQGDVSEWSRIFRLYAADSYTVGVTYDGEFCLAGTPPFDPAVLRSYPRYPTDVVLTATHLTALYPDGSVCSTLHHTDDWQYVRAIAAGHGFTVGLCYGGRVVAAGQSTAHGCDVSDWRNIVAVDCGVAYTVGLTSDGRVLLAGCVPEATDPRARAFDGSRWQEVLTVRAGAHHLTALTRSGQVLACGSDSDGQCTAIAHFTLFRDQRQLYGYGQYAQRTEQELNAVRAATVTEATAAEELGILPFSLISASLRAYADALSARVSGDNRALTVLSEDGRVMTYTYATQELSVAEGAFVPVTRPDTPTPADARVGAVAVASCATHTATLFRDGHVRVTGAEGSSADTADWERIVQIAVLPDLTLGLRADGRIMAAGRHNEVLHTLDTVRAMVCLGDRRQVFIMTDGSVRIHDRGSEYLPEAIEEVRLFTPTVENSVLKRCSMDASPALMAKALHGTVALGLVHTLSLGRGGEITALGVGESGQCDVAAYRTAVAVSAGPYHSAAVLADGRVALSGRNGFGQSDARTLNRALEAADGVISSDVADGVEHDASVLPFAWRAVACGYDHTAALRTDGRVFAIGENTDGRCDTAAWRNIRSIACGVSHTVGVTEEGTCVAVGDHRYGQCDVSGWRQISSVAAGEFHTVGLRSDGRVVAAGDNRRGQCRVDDLRDIIAIACLPEATLCVSADGRVILRGGPDEMDEPVEKLREIVAIHACEYRVAALTADRRLILIP